LPLFLAKAVAIAAAALLAFFCYHLSALIQWAYVIAWKALKYDSVLSPPFFVLRSFS
jgi:hypothetical protein